MKHEHDKLLDYFSEQESKFHQQSANTLRTPSPNNVHQLRVTLRRLFTVFWLAERASENISLTGLIEPFSHLSHDLGQLREIDVAIIDAKEFHLNPGPLKNKRKQLLKKILIDLKMNHRRELFGFLQQVHGQMSRNSELDIKPGNRVLGKKSKAWSHKGVQKGESLHQLRLFVKKTRFALEISKKSTKPVRKLQNVLGRGHDLRVLEELLGKNPKIRTQRKKFLNKARKLLKPSLKFARGELLS